MLSVFDHGAPPPCPAPFNLAAYVLARATTLGNKPALIILGETGRDTWTFAELEAAVRGTGSGLLQAGLVPGDRVILRLGNTVDFPIAYLGALAAGLVPVPTSALLTPRETARIAHELDARAVLHDPTVAGAPAAVQIPVDDLRAMRAAPPCGWHMGDPERLGYVVYTSGSSGKPRAVAHAHRAIWARRMMFEDWYGLTQKDRLLHAGAFNWTYTLGTGLMDPWTVGATALIPAQGTLIEHLPHLLLREDATIFAAVPGVYRKILKACPSLSLPTLRHGLTAGEKLSDRLQRAWSQTTGTALLEAFGMSECSTFVSASPSAPARDGALGRPQRGRRVAVLGEDGPAPTGEAGIIAVHRDDPGLMLGYLNASEPFDGQLSGDWFCTGDRGVMDASGAITYLGRNDDLMNAGGFRVSPLEVEAVLSAFDGIDQIGVTDVEIKQDVRIIVAFYVGHLAVDDPELSAFAKANLASYKVPKAWVRLPKLPTNANGKLMRKALRDLYEAAQ